MAIVIDASITLAWLLPHESSEPLETLLRRADEPSLRGPSHFPVELSVGVEVLP